MRYDVAGLVLIAGGRTRYGAALEIVGADGAVTRRELRDVSFVQAQINKHMGEWASTCNVMLCHVM